MQAIHFGKWAICAVLPLFAMMSCSSGGGQGGSSGGGGMPKVTEAKALSNHYVEVTFANTVGGQAMDRGRYRIVASDGSELEILDVLAGDSDKQTILATRSQTEDVEYTLMTDTTTSIESGQSITGTTDSSTGDSVTFAASTGAEPFLMTAIALSETTVLLTFSESMDEDTTENEAFYRIADPDLDIDSNGAALQVGNDDNQVILTTSTQQNILYTAKATNLRSSTGDKLIDPERNTADFHGIAPNDTDSPTVLSAVATSAINVLVSFSEPVSDDAADPTKYGITPSLGIVDAALSTFKTQALLTTFPMIDGREYTVTVTGIRDRETPTPNDIGTSGNTAVFVYDAAAISAANPDAAADPPRVVGAVSGGNKLVIVAFNKAMGDSAIDPIGYQIIQEGVQPEAGVLDVVAAEFYNGDPATVLLTTLPQNEVIYELKVVGAKDVQGNPLAPPELLVDPSKATFRGTPPSCPLFCSNGELGFENSGGGACQTDEDCGKGGACRPVCDSLDSDGDGIPDHIEQRGWIVTVELTARSGFFDRKLTQSRDVTSDPFVADTDADGLSDFTERELATDPREKDTDGDGLTDEQEFNLFFSSPTDQDTDEDQLDDFLEATFFKTSPILADTDGDGLNDDRELLELNRDPRVADLPRWRINIGDIRLQIDERYTFVDSTGETVTQVSNTTTTLTQSREDRLINTDTNTWSAQLEVGADFGVDQGKPTLLGGIHFTGGYENVSQVESGSVITAQQAYESSLSRGREFTTTRQVTREVFGASIDIPVTFSLADGEDLAFTISNLELSVLQAGRDRTRLVPIATLVPNSLLLTGEDTVLNIGPFVPERGPIIMGTKEVFPSLVENLLRSPRGPIIIPSNFDITDEFGRNFAFTSQEANDRTAGIIIDYGDGTVDRFLVAIAGGLDDKGFAGPAGEFVGFFGERGQPLGIPMDYALQDILGFEKNRTDPDSILAGKNGIAETFAAGDDVQLINPGLTGFDDREVVITAGDDGILQSTSAGDDVQAVTTGYETSPTCNENTTEQIWDAGTLNGSDGLANTARSGDDVQLISVGTSVSTNGAPIIGPGTNGIIDTALVGDDELRGPGRVCDDDGDCAGAGLCDGRKTIRRFKNSITGDQRRFWAVYTDRIVPVGTDFGKIILEPRMIVNMSLIQDIDRDGLSAREEFTYGSSDRLRDTDNDGLSDFAEIRTGWTVLVQGREGYIAFPDPRIPDSDGDGLSDSAEMTCGTDPRKRDTDDDGVDDFTEGCDDGGLDPLNSDTDGDGLLDGIEPFLCNDMGGCGNPLDPDDAEEFLDTDEDGITNANEILGWTVSVDLCNNTCSQAFNGQCNDSGDSFCSNNSFFAGDSCNNNSDCDSPNNPACVETGFCGNSIGVTCDQHTDCDFGTCDFGSCTVSGSDCTFNFQCVSLCVPAPSFCNDASLNVGHVCAVDAHCVPYPSGNCITPSQCNLGTDCADCGKRTINTVEKSDPTLGDTDFDGLPDLLEKTLGSNPNTPDTDGDGLLDHDEFDDFGLFFPLNFQHEGFFLNDAGSLRIGTDLTSQDTDGDRLSDNFELLDGWRVLSIVDNEAREVTSSPLFDDSDFDQLDDLAEFLGADGLAPSHSNDNDDSTDPTDPDTDGDSRLDSTEIDVGSDPLLPDIFVTASIERFSPLKGPEDGSNNKNEWSFDIRIQRPLQDEDQSLVDDQDVCGSDCGSNCHTLWILTDRTNVDVNRSLSFDMPLGDPILIDVVWREVDACNNGVANTSCIFIEERIVTTEALLSSGGLLLEPFVFQDGPCDIGFTIKFLVDGPTSGN